MRRFLPSIALILIPAILVISALPGSPGARIRQVSEAYMLSIEEGRPGDARALLTDSLAGLVSEAAMGHAGFAGPPSPGGGSIGRQEQRGWPFRMSLPDGGSRLLWLRFEEGEWRISGDSMLDALMGSASVICRDFALSSVLPAVAAGALAPSFTCPVSGLPYEAVDGVLACPSGHLGDGIDLLDDACGARRAEAASVVADWVGEGHPLPSTLEEIWELSGGVAGLPGGYRCPVNGYSFYTLTDSGVRCPYHMLATPVYGD